MIMRNLSDREATILEQLAQEGTAPHTQRARAVLLEAQGKNVDEISIDTQLTTRQVQYWLKQYAERGFDIFPEIAPAKSDNGHHPRRTTPRARLSKVDKPGVSADDPMSEAGRKVMAFYLVRLLEEEENVRNEAHGEAVHDMRVATRRLRSALDIFSSFYRKHVTKRLRNDLRKLGRALGAVRDLEVVRKKVDTDAESLSASIREGLQPLLDNWHEQLQANRQDLVDLLDSERYAELLDYTVDFVSTLGKDAAEMPNEHEPTPYLVRHVVPALIYQQYEIVRAYEPFLTGVSLDTLHALRIEAKRLRYRLESFEEVLTSDAKRVVEATKALQDHLGELQDSRVATGLMQNFIHHADEYQSVTAILQYMAIREEEKQRLLAGVEQTWEAFVHPDIRRAISRSISML
jgi:CHAD domain-containing protein